MAQSQTFQRKNVFKDFDLSFSKHPLTGDLSTKTDVNAINQSLKSLVATNFYERPFNPETGCNVRGLLFELADDITIADVRQTLTDTITNFEPRVELIDLIVEDLSDSNAYLVKIIYRVSFKQEPVTFDVVLERLR